MFRALASLLLLAQSALAAGSLAKLKFRGSAKVDASLGPRGNTCRFCYRQCPVACYVGTCGLNFGFEARRFGTSNQCWSCEPSSGVGFAEAGDFLLCSADEAAATKA